MRVSLLKREGKKKKVSARFLPLINFSRGGFSEADEKKLFKQEAGSEEREAGKGGQNCWATNKNNNAVTHKQGVT